MNDITDKAVLDIPFELAKISSELYVKLADVVSLDTTKKDPIIFKMYIGQEINLTIGVYKDKINKPTIDILVYNNLSNRPDELDILILSEIIKFATISKSAIVFRNVSSTACQQFLEKSSFIKSNDIIWPTYGKRIL